MSELIKQNDLEQIRDKFVTLTDKDTFLKEASFALQIINKSDILKKCDKNSLLGAVMNVANTGLTLNPIMKLAYIVPRYIDRKMQACLEPSYQGLVKLITDAGSVTSISCNLVRENDEFDYQLASDQKIIHKPKLGNKGDIIGAYAVAVLKDGSQMVEVMDKEEIESIRDTSESYKAYKDGKIKSCVWVDYPGEMFRKTVLRRIVKYLPKTDKWNTLQEAINLDERDFQASDNMIGYIDSLLHNAAIPDENKRRILNEMYGYTSSEASMCITYLKENQIDNIDAGDNYGQKDINNKLDKMGLCKT